MRWGPDFFVASHFVVLGGIGFVVWTRVAACHAVVYFCFTVDACGTVGVAVSFECWGWSIAGNVSDGTGVG